MYIESIEVQHSDRLGRAYKHTALKFCCDACGNEFITRDTRVLTRKTHTCSRDCNQKARHAGGVIAAAMAATNLELYGAENVYASPVIRERIKQRHMERRGVENPFQDPVVKQRSVETTMEHHGVKHAMQSPMIREKSRQTMLKNWGVEHPMQLAHVQRALEDGCMAKYGVKRALALPDVFRRVHEARKASGAYARQSKSENAFHALLVELFGDDDVERWVVVNEHWPIDFRVKSLDTYVQFDGVYWHGLDRPIEQIRASEKVRDKAIVGKWELDQRQNRWFVEHDMRLVRITDTAFKSDPKDCLRKIAGMLE